MPGVTAEELIRELNTVFEEFMRMSKKTCDAWTCTNQTNAKYRYCYDCAKSKGLIKGSGGSLIGEIAIVVIAVLILAAIF